VNGGALVVVGWCALLALVVGLTWLQAAGSVASWPYLGHTLGLLGWGGAIAVRPELLSWQRGGWIAALLAVVVAPRLVAKRRADSAGEQGRALGPPRREVEGRLALDQVVLGDGAGLTLTPPWDVRIAAGESLALLCDDGPIREAVVAVMAGLRPPVSGRVVIDGVPLEPDDRLVAVVAPGDPFIAGSLVANLGALAGRELEPAQVRAAVESCGLSDARDRLGEGDLDPSGAPLEPAERMLVAVGRALVSHARIVVVADPRPWVDEAAAEQWRRAIVRASVGRTALWLTTDRQLARRADRRGTVTGGRIDWDHGARP
jgi:predicted ABC-type transport system involved in lysophospholipase L1 biosynthesis ATPase subunit